MPLEYSWSRDRKPIPGKTRYEDLNRILVIENAQFEDEGTYICSVSSTKGFDEKKFTFALSGNDLTITSFFIFTNILKQHYRCSNLINLFQVCTKNTIETEGMVLYGMNFHGVNTTVKLRNSLFFFIGFSLYDMIMKKLKTQCVDMIMNNCEHF